jgi:hypothetical protein
MRIPGLYRPCQAVRLDPRVDETRAPRAWLDPGTGRIHAEPCSRGRDLMRLWITRISRITRNTRITRIT